MPTFQRFIVTKLQPLILNQLNSNVIKIFSNHQMSRYYNEKELNSSFITLLIRERTINGSHNFSVPFRRRNSIKTKGDFLALHVCLLYIFHYCSFFSPMITNYVETMLQSSQTEINKIKYNNTCATLPSKWSIDVYRQLYSQIF